MINLGMDFGSTYTMVSILENGEPRTVQSSHLMFHYPSIVCYDEDKNKYFYGTSARERLGKKGIVGFRGFKMLLNEQMNPQMLRERNYSDKHTPEFITSFFLRSVLENTLKKLGEDKIGLLVIGAPECWFQSIRTIDARGTLRVELRSEPTDAAAFCVWNYEKKNKKQFDGSILVVDYGGGTLDTALVSVSHIEDKVQIKPEMLSGIGENSDREIGKAGIAYQEAVVRKAISEALGVPEAQINTNPSFDRAVKDLEDALITDCELIDDTFADYVATPSQLKDEILLSVKYNGWDVDINFAQMKQAYDETIHSELQRVLEESSRELGEGEQPYLALVGGFCNFYLVREQIQSLQAGRCQCKSQNTISQGGGPRKGNRLWRVFDRQQGDRRVLRCQLRHRHVYQIQQPRQGIHALRHQLRSGIYPRQNLFCTGQGRHHRADDPHRGGHLPVEFQ